MYNSNQDFYGPDGAGIHIAKPERREPTDRDSGLFVTKPFTIMSVWFHKTFKRHVRILNDYPTIGMCQVWDSNGSVYDVNKNLLEVRNNPT